MDTHVTAVAVASDQRVVGRGLGQQADAAHIRLRDALKHRIRPSGVVNG